MRRTPKLVGADDASHEPELPILPRKEKKACAPKDPNRPLRGQLEDLMLVVSRCESMWALENRIEGSLDNDPKAA
ncbi:MAG: hypothetical protein E6I69_13310 [Chloroflexi bacterium]|nr:MAG: hypothetical protein E6I69_13310 [Chloroflexota bacterium]